MTESDEPRIAGLLLAAGGSSRLGRPKQLVEFEGKTLIRRAAEALIEAGCSPVIVVLGPDATGSSELRGLLVNVAENPNWRSGISSSIAAGIDRLLEAGGSVDAVLITLCDQPFVTGSHLSSFAERFRTTRAPIVAAEYNGVLGVPALFAAEKFAGLRQLEGDKGAKELIRAALGAASIPLPEAAIDIDTAPDVNALGSG